MKKILAFSLAEVLIALSIIGIVGALTLPNVKKSYDQKEAHAKATKVQHLLDTATLALIRDNESFENVIRGNSSETDRSLALLNAYSKYLKFTMVCGKTSSSTACFPTGYFGDPMNTAGGEIYENNCVGGQCSVQKTSVRYFTPVYPNCDVSPGFSGSYSAALQCVLTTTPGNSDSKCATAVLNDGTAIALCSVADKKKKCLNKYVANSDTFCPDVAVYFGIKGPKALKSSAITKDVFFGYLSEVGFTDYNKTISAISNGSFK